MFLQQKSQVVVFLTLDVMVKARGLMGKVKQTLRKVWKQLESNQESQCL
jgi:hypothetical protein